MEKFDQRVDTYIHKSADFAKPILNHLRELIHLAAPGINETIKWGFPHFDYKGTVFSMASFKRHCAFGFWKSSLLPDPYNLLNSESANAMGQFGRIGRLADLPADEILIEYIRNAVVLNETGVEVVKKPKAATTASEIVIPDYFAEALSKNNLAKSNFQNISYSHRKEYIEWLTEAKTEATRQKRMATALLWLSEGKGRNWKYER